MKRPWLEWVFAAIMLGLLIALASTSCITTGSTKPAVLSEVSESIYRLRCQCGGVAWVRVETMPTLRVTVTSENAPLGVYIRLDDNGVAKLRCCCGWIHFLLVQADENGILIGIIHSEPPATSPPKKEPVMA